MTKFFVIRIDLESSKGITEGLPKLLELFKEEKVKGSFYIVMGGESNLLEILKNRGTIKSANERKIRLWSIKEKLRMALLPTNFTRNNQKLIKRILSEGHELGLHGWKHREWTRSLEKVPVSNRLDKMLFYYKKYFSSRPISWAAPGFNTNKRVLDELEKRGILYVSDFDEMKKFGKIRNVPINIMGEGKTPFIEYWVGEGKTDDEILEIFKEKIKGKTLASFYLHGMFEGRFKIDLLRRMIRVLKKNNFKNKRIMDFR